MRERTIHVMPGHVAGRDAELASIRDFVASVSDGAAALVLEGEAGMGKTTLWSVGVAEAVERGFLTLRALPSANETTLSFSAVGDLLDPVLDRALEPLAEAQRRALARALLLGEDEGPPPDPRAVGVALLNVLRELAREQTVVVAVDDVQWLDPASSGALGYAGRRLGEASVGLLLTQRAGTPVGLLGELKRSLVSDRFLALEVGPLDVSALHRVVLDKVGVVLPRPLLAEIHAAAGGNPFYALEIVRMLQRGDVVVEAGQPLPVPESLHELVQGRLLALPPRSRDFLLAAAVHAHPTVSITEAASGVAREEGLTPALEARVVTVEGDRMRFTHPLLSAGVYETADPGRRAEVHARLAGLLENPEARAWQLAASVSQPDVTVAGALEDAARHARERGAPRPAALLLERARELTPSDQLDDAVRRAVDAAFLHFESGDSARAETQLEQIVDELSAGPARARAILRLARIRSYESARDARVLYMQVLEEAGDDRRSLAEAHEGIAVCLFWLCEQLDDALAHSSLAAELAHELGDEQLASDALAPQIPAETLLGREAAGVVERALSAQDRSTRRRVMEQPLIAVAEHWLWTDQLERSRSALLELLGRAQRMGDESSPPYVYLLLGLVECSRGDLRAALDAAQRAREAAEQSGQRMFSAYGFSVESMVEAHRGRQDDARDAARRALELAPDGFVRIVAAAALGHLELTSSNLEDVVTRLGPEVVFVRRERIAEPAAVRFVVDHIEALIELGRGDEAVEILDWYEGHARRLERASALASSLRCRGLLAAQAGRVEEACDIFEQALEWHARVDVPLEQGRTLLAFGVTQRRAKRRREARETLEEALAIFERIGASLWAERIRGEMRRVSGRAPAAGALTPAEERVAALVAEGKTNREVAAALFLSERTVEGHLSRVFGKLGLRSRTELARALAGSDQGVGESNTGGSPVSADRVAP